VARAAICLLESRGANDNVHGNLAYIALGGQTKHQSHVLKLLFFWKIKNFI